MSNKIVHFPVSVMTKSKGVKEVGSLSNSSMQQYVSSDKLSNLRDAFDLARKGWPVEAPELPEENKIYSYKR
ncbi:hypothetical protein [Marinomonas sp. 2405UD68-3]|uniref:hypothetical protein n=1 Tax=Marinomonas sp. 2405UD68-3 TaxID=3391835 RepID=UPI0039C8F6C3